MRRLRILHTESSRGWGGQEIRILSEAAGMIRRGHAITILSCPGSNIYRAARNHGIAAVALPLEKKRWRNLKALRAWLGDHAQQFDIVNTHSSTDAWLAAIALGRERKLPVVRTRHVSTAVSNNIATRWLYRSATSHVVTTGERLRQQLHRDNAIPFAHMTSVPTGIDLTRYRPGDAVEARRELGLPACPAVGIVATLRSWKGHQDLLSVWARLDAQASAWQLIVVGDGPQRAAIEAAVQSMGLGKSVTMTGNRDDAERWLRAFDVFVLPSYGNEGVPQGIMQAMASALPVVSTHVGAIDEAVVDGVTGSLVPPRDQEALAAALSALMADPALRARFAAAGLARAHERFGLDRMLDEMEAIFARVVDAK